MPCPFEPVELRRPAPERIELRFEQRTSGSGACALSATFTALDIALDDPAPVGATSLTITGLMGGPVERSV